MRRLSIITASMPDLDEMRKRAGGRRQGIHIKIAVILSGAPRGRRWGGTESKNPASARRVFGEGRMPLRHSTGSFTARRPATFAHAGAPFRMTS